ncbi:class I SAM-dependent methyltransferase [Acidovorax sp. sif1233]|uniref:class I SAM-dependent methyltransferase n=1 Tax=Acidovorax sp. sif1233 TaxID=2854792 RepID=UPI001C495475|nr:class I SAM-dependent methyltransferase [Acidovorax sp. sif1233]MBV7454227.1 class I SAM-dependent methyltransferase [Acidovorax sp. sif1233]
MTHPTASPFTDPAAVARYAEGPRRNVPGYDSLLPMVRILLAERVPADGRVLVVGAGGGLELEDMALAHPGWRFDGVDPSQPMLDLAAQRLQSAGVSNDRVALHHGYVQSAPAGPFDGATCLLTFHFVPREERAAMVAEIRRRLKPGAPFVAVHLSVADGDASDYGGEGGAGERDLWLSRYAAFQVASGVPPEHAARARDKIAAELAVLTPEEDEAILREAGFSDVQMFYMGFAFRGWVARA